MDYLKRGDNWIPRLGLGTYEIKGRQGRGALEFALDCGYRHFDTAQAYQNEAEIGKVLARTSIPRERLFITTKIYPLHLGKEKFLPSLEQSLRALKQDFVDLLLIHWPSQTIALEESLDLLQEAREKQYCRLIGVSNFNLELLQRVENYKVDIACNQFEYHSFLDQSKLLEKTHSMGCFATAYSPIARGLVNDEPVLKEIAAYKRKTPAQIALRWLMQQDQLVAIPKSVQIKRIKQNFDIFTFSLSAEEMDRITRLTHQNKRLIQSEFAPTWDWN